MLPKIGGPDSSCYRSDQDCCFHGVVRTAAFSNGAEQPNLLLVPQSFRRTKPTDNAVLRIVERGCDVAARRDLDPAVAQISPNVPPIHAAKIRWKWNQKNARRRPAWEIERLVQMPSMCAITRCIRFRIRAAILRRHAVPTASELARAVNARSGFEFTTAQRVIEPIVPSVTSAAPCLGRRSEHILPQLDQPVFVVPDKSRAQSIPESAPRMRCSLVICGVAAPSNR